MSPSATAAATATLATSETEDPTTPKITWSTEIRTVRSVSEELRSSLRSCGACAWPMSRREMRSAWAAFAAPTVSQRPSTESRLRVTKSAAVIASRTSAAW